MTDWRKDTKVFYGWYMAAAVFVVLFFTGGAGFYVFPVFIGSLQDEFGWSITQISATAGLWAIVFGLSGPLIGVLIARYGVRAVFLTAAIMASVSNLGLALLSSLWMLYLLMVLGGFVVAGTTLLPSQTLVTNWFNQYRGRAMALTLMGIGFGGFALPPLNEFLIRSWGWRYTWAFGCVLLWLIVIPLIVIFVRTRPSDCGLRPDGLSGCDQTASGVALRSGLPVAQALKTREFTLLVGIYLLQLIGMSTLNFHFVPFASQEAGFSPQQAAFFFGLAIGFSVPGKVLFGWLADRFNPAYLQAWTGVLMALGLISVEIAVLQFGLTVTYPLWIYAAFYGVGFGGQVIVLPVLVGRCFGELNFSKLIGLVMSGFALGILIGIPMAGWSYDRFGSYEIAFLACITMFLLSAVTALFVRWRHHKSKFVSEEVGS